jgi:hypothetical protein
MHLNAIRSEADALIQPIFQNKKHQEPNHFLENIWLTSFRNNSLK